MQVDQCWSEWALSAASSCCTCSNLCSFPDGWEKLLWMDDPPSWLSVASLSFHVNMQSVTLVKWLHRTSPTLYCGWSAEWVTLCAWHHCTKLNEKSGESNKKLFFHFLPYFLIFVLTFFLLYSRVVFFQISFIYWFIDVFFFNSIDNSFSRVKQLNVSFIRTVISCMYIICCLQALIN